MGPGRLRPRCGRNSRCNTRGGNGRHPAAPCRKRTPPRCRARRATRRGRARARPGCPAWLCRGRDCLGSGRRGRRWRGAGHAGRRARPWREKGSSHRAASLRKRSRPGSRRTGRGERPRSARGEWVRWFSRDLFREPAPASAAPGSRFGRLYTADRRPTGLKSCLKKVYVFGMAKAEATLALRPAGRKPHLEFGAGSSRPGVGRGTVNVLGGCEQSMVV